MLLLISFSCERTYDPVPEHLNGIFPLTNGKSRVYKVIDTSYASVNGVESQSFFRKETHDGTETDLLGREVTKMYLYDSPDSTDSLGNRVYQWTFTQLWTQYLDDAFAERIEGNIRYLVLKIPPVTGSSWNGNLYNSGDVETYRVLNDDTTITIQGTTYANCVFVQQVPYRKTGIDPSSIFFLVEYAYEIYAPGIGKIARYRKYFEAQSNVINSASHVYYEELVSHNY
jgi:hypothetical protein